MTVDDVLCRMAQRVKQTCGWLPEPELDRLVTELFLDAARFGLEWETSRSSVNHDNCHSQITTKARY